MSEQYVFTVTEIRNHTILASNTEEAIQKCQDSEGMLCGITWECEQ
jgi:hypothetical protein